MTVGIVAAAAPETAWKVDAARASDGHVLDALFESCSVETVYRRFFGRPATLPRSYRAAVLAQQPSWHDAVVVRYGDGLHVAGVASLATDPVTVSDAELGVLVADGWQRRGLGSAMVDALIARARDRGVQRVAAEVLVSRSALLRALGRRLELQRLTRAADTMTGLFAVETLTVERHASRPADLRR